MINKFLLMKLTGLTLLCFVCHIAFTQNVQVKLSNAVKQLETDVQFKHAILSLYVVDTKTGKVIFDKNSQVGLSPSSCQKVVTSVSAFEMLGKSYTYKTEMAFEGFLRDSIIIGDLYFMVSGDPTLGSWRWSETKEEKVKQKILAALKYNSVTRITGDLVIDDLKWESQATPNGWVWEDIGNYYGAGARGFNWHENQYDLILKPGKRTGDSVQIISTNPPLQVLSLVNELKTGKEESGDQSVIYLPENGLIGYVRGSVPQGKNTFTVSGSLPNPDTSFLMVMKDVFDKSGIRFSGRSRKATPVFRSRESVNSPIGNVLLSIDSPRLDSINYWFLKKSVNLYGEAFVKTIACEKTKFGSTDTGINIIKNFWKERGIEKSALNIIDGSGLSPANRVTANALVTVMQYARQQNWFPSFYYALPETNGIKMKDGYISGVRSYTGYVKSKAGTEYTFSFIVNNFDDNPGTVREKMWKLLDILK